MKISACWIAKDEEQTIGRSIDSVKAIVDELVVVDTGSADGTVAAAREHGARTDFFEWRDDFSAARNYAMSKVKGEIVVFLDADEWFEPALTRADRKVLEDIFTRNASMEVLQIPIRNLGTDGRILSTGKASRFLRKRVMLTFKNAIHERYMKVYGAEPDTVFTELWTLMHSGYAAPAQERKNTRNLHLLRTSLRRAADEEERMLNRCYLVRELRNLGQMDEAFEHLQDVLAAPELLFKLMARFQDGFVPLHYVLIEMAGRFAEQVDLETVRTALFEPFKTYYPDYPGTAMIDLYYNILFALDEDAILDGIDGALAAAEKKGGSPYSGYETAEAWVCYRAAHAAYIRGDIGRAERYVTLSLGSPAQPISHALHLLLLCVKDRPTEEIIRVLDSLIDGNIPENRTFLALNTRVHGLKTVHVHYLEKLVATGELPSDEYTYLFARGLYVESIAAALRQYDEDTAATITLHLFLAVVCSDDRQLFEQHRQLLLPYVRLLDSFFGGEPLQQFSQSDMKVYQSAYPMIAFAAGLETADRLGIAFRGLDRFLYRVKAQYCVDNGLKNEMPPAPQLG